MTLFTDSMNELELYAELLVDALPRSKRREVGILKEMNPATLAYKAAVELNSSVDTFKPLTTICCSLGKTVLIGKEDLSENEETIQVRRFGVGYEIISPLLENKKIKLERGKHIRDPYYIKTEDKDFMEKLFFIVNTNPQEIPIPSRPLLSKPQPFKSFHHPVMGELVRGCNNNAVASFTMEKSPQVLEAINKHIGLAWLVNTDLLEVYKGCREDDIFTLNGTNYTQEQKDGMLREMNGVIDIATGVGKRTFWESMFYDSRGRLYSSAVYFSHQGSKLSKSLFYMSKKKRIGREGWFWMMVHLANCYGYDKAPIDDRFQFSEDHLDEWLVWAEDPINNKGWQSVDEDKFGFLATILEVKKAIDSGDKYSFRSGLLLAWDATCSGLQVLSAVSRDEKSGVLCNLTLSEERGDYYQAIANHVWADIECSDEERKEAKKVLAKIEEMEQNLEDMKDDAELVDINKRAEKIRKALAPIKKKVDKLGDQCPQEIVDAQWELQNKLDEIGEDKIYKQFQEIGRMWFGEDGNIDLLAKEFWTRPEAIKMQRKLCKRPCMTYFYSCQARTMAKQLLRDHKEALPELKKQFCMWLCIRIYNACREVMPGPTSVMDAFIDLGLKSYQQKKDFDLFAPRTGFHMMHRYYKAKYKNVKIHYRGKRIRLKLMVGTTDKLDYQKIISAVSPNVVHMLDGEIVKAVILDTNYNVSCIHDSFSAIPADAGKLYEDTRAAFVGLFTPDVLQDIFDQKGEKNNIKYGELDIEWSLDNWCNFL